MAEEKKTTKEKPAQEVPQELVIDATGMKLGRLATQTAMALMGKDRPSFKRNVFSGRKVLIKNASKINITDKKLKDEIYHTRFSGYPSGLTITTGSETVKTKGYSELVRLAVSGMLPKNKLKKQMIKNLEVEE